MAPLEKFKVITAGMAYQVTCEKKETELLLTSLINLQNIFGIFINLHPESIYSQQHKYSSDVFDNNIVIVSGETTVLIDEALNIWQTIAGNILPFTRNKQYCFRFLTTVFQGAKYSFHGIILKILSNCQKLVSYLDNLEIGEIVKGQLDMVRSREMGKKFSIGKPPSAVAKEKEGIAK